MMSFLCFIIDNRHWRVSHICSSAHVAFDDDKNLFYWKTTMVGIRDGHADIFGDAHRCVCWIYPTYVGYSAILSDNAEVDADIRIRMAIPGTHRI